MDERRMDAPFPLADHITREWYPGAALPLPGAVMDEPFGLFIDPTQAVSGCWRGTGAVA